MTTYDIKFTDNNIKNTNMVTFILRFSMILFFLL